MNRKVLIASVASLAVGLTFIGLASTDEFPFRKSTQANHDIPTWAQGVPPPNVAQLTELRQRLIDEARSEGESHPFGGLVVATRRQEFLRAATGADVPDDRDVYVISAHGNFTAYGASTPGPGMVPTGHFIMGVLDAQTLELLDFEIGDPIDTSRYGAAYILTLP